MVEYERRTVLSGIGAVGAASVFGVGIASADDDGGDGEAKIRVAHASPDAPNVDVFVDGAKVLKDVPFKTVSKYLELATGTYEVAIAAASEAESPDEADKVVFQSDVTVGAEDYTAAAIGELAPEGDEPGFTLDIFEDKLGVLDDGQGRARVYHASPDAGTVDVAVADENNKPALYLAQGLEFGSAGPNLEVDAGTYPIAVYPAGSSTPAVGPVDVEVRAGEVLTAFAEGELSPEADGSGFEIVRAYEEAAPFGGPPNDDDDDEDDDGQRGPPEDADPGN